MDNINKNRTVGRIDRDSLLTLKELLIILFSAIIIFWGGYFIWFCSGFMNNGQNSESYLTVSTLNGFYSSLFAAITIVFALIALISWRSIENQVRRYKDKFKQIEHVIDDYNKIKDDVDFLLKKKNYAKRVQEIVESDENSKVSCQLKLSEQDKITLKEIKEFIMNDHEENAWLEIFVAHDLVFNDDNVDPIDLEAAEKIYKYNESRNLFKPNSVIEPYLYHFMGELKHVKYDKHIENCSVNDPADIKEAVKILQESKSYYNKSLEHRIEKEKLQTRANLAVVLIDLAKCEKRRLEIETICIDSDESREIIESYLNEAMVNLNLVKKQKPDFNTYWDLARVAYYLNNGDNINTLLEKAADMITIDKEMQTFISTMRYELKEFNGTGFPGDGKIIDSLEKKLKDKLF